MSDMSKWPPSKNDKFTQAWVKLSQLPGGMMQSYSVERGHFRYGPIPASTHCTITTNPDDAQRWRELGEPVLEVYTASGVALPLPPSTEGGA